MKSSGLALEQVRAELAQSQSERDVAVERCSEAAREMLQVETLRRNAIDEAASKVHSAITVVHVVV